jgi:hypothetical protein
LVSHAAARYADRDSKARYDGYRIIDDPGEEGVGESAQQRAADIGKDQRKLKRIGSQPLGDLVELCAEAGAQTDRLRFVPVLRFACFDLRC